MLLEICILTSCKPFWFLRDQEESNSIQTGFQYRKAAKRLEIMQGEAVYKMVRSETFLVEDGRQYLETMHQ